MGKYLCGACTNEQNMGLRFVDIEDDIAYDTDPRITPFLTETISCDCINNHEAVFTTYKVPTWLSVLNEYTRVKYMEACPVASEYLDICLSNRDFAEMADTFFPLMGLKWTDYPEVFLELITKFVENIKENYME